MINKDLKSLNNRPNRHGIVLMVVLVMLVVLSVVGYTLTSRVTAQRHRDQYIIDYQAARYGCDSALKYALAALEDMNSPKLIERPDEPDFSDLFTFTETEYKEFLEQWAEQIAERHALTEEAKSKSGQLYADVNDLNDINNISDINSALSIDFWESKPFDPNDPNTFVVRGPYGPLWPLVTRPAQFAIGTAKIEIEIHDENAKYPIGWAMLDDKQIRREALAGFKTFCEWMDVNNLTVDSLQEQLQDLNKIKKFNVNFKDIEVKKREKVKVTRRTRGRRRSPARTRTKTIVTKIPATVHLTDFAKLFHCSLVNLEELSRPTILSESRQESALKYMAIWGSGKVNVNTATRQVLEAAFVFGGDADRIADEIIQRRRIKPFENVAELQKLLFKYTDSIDKCKEYIATRSDFFTIRVTAVSGVAEASAVIAVRSNKGKMEKIAVLSG